MALADRVIVITGASSGIGAALARHAASAGASVVLAARRAPALNTVAEACGGESRALAFPCDVTKRGDHEALLAAALKRFGKVDCWVNNAGVGITKPVQLLTDEDLDSMMTVNVKSVLYGMQTVVPYYKEQRRGQCINIGSLLGRTPFASLRAAYSASKAAMGNLTTNMRVDLQNEGFRDIRIALLSPGLVATEFGVNAVHGGPDSRLMAGGQTAEEVAEEIARMIADPSASVDAYSRPHYRQMIAAWYAAEDVRDIEGRPPFATAAVQSPPVLPQQSAG